MTKTEQKKIETEIKHAFIEKVYMTILKSIPKQTKKMRNSLDIRIAHKNQNRYIHFHSYGQDVKFRIYGDGNIGIMLNEFCHDKYEAQIFEYTAEKEAQEEFLKRLSKTMSWIIPLFLDKESLDFHSYMDFLSYSNDIYDAYDKMQQEVKSWKKDKR